MKQTLTTDALVLIIDRRLHLAAQPWSLYIPCESNMQGDIMNQI